ncbi:MAG TPA: hypothetical protein VFE33_25985 [Thermoanaerobaculia bacterium]|nr:hypothetical protein [Thermoanaerobaculia bacterium]
MKGEQSTEISWVDVVVICALEVEFRALSETLTRHPELATDSGLGLQHFVALGDRGLSVLVVWLPDPKAGNVISGIVASFLIARYDPWLLISFGIAGTLDPEEMKASEVLYSRAVFYIDLRKETDGGSVMKRTVQRDTRQPLLGLLYNLPPPHGYILHKEVDIVSSEAVVKSREAERRKAAKTAVADAKAVEMEAFGVFQAAFVDNEFFSRTPRLCLAIKSISDKADQDKKDEYHEPAANNAAKFLSTVLNAPGLTALRGNAGVDQRPRPLQPFIRLRPREVLARVTLFNSIVHSIARPGWDDSTLHAVHIHCRYPRIFYHWRFTGEGLHWVEFKFLRVLRHLSDAGYPVECLITDEVIDMPHRRLTRAQVPEVREIIQKMVDDLLPPHSWSAVSFLSRICENEDELDRFARAAGYWREIRNRLEGMSSLPTMPVGNSQLSREFNEWLKYIAWRVRHEGACIVFYFCDREIYSLLWRFSGLLPALIPTADIKFADNWGKFESPGEGLFLFPPDHPAIIQWLTATSNHKTLAEFWCHLTSQEGLSEEVLIRNRRAWGGGRGLAGNLPRGSDMAWVKSFLAGEDKTPEYYKGAILLELAWLNETFFVSFREK